MTDAPDEFVEAEMTTATVTCHTDECGNAGYALDVPVTVENPYVVCGVCGQQITDIE